MHRHLLFTLSREGQISLAGPEAKTAGFRSAVVAGFAVLAACGGPQISNAPPSVAEDCQREVALITESFSETTRAGPSPRDASESAEAVVEDARAGRAEAEEAGLAAWPADVLLYRCLASRGVELTPEQSRILSEWEARNEPDE